MPAADPQATEKPPPVDESSEVNTKLALEFLLDAQANYSLEEIEKSLYVAVVRKKVFDEWATRMRLKKITLEGDTTVRDAPAKAVQPPDPATMFSHPALEAPYYDRQAGSEMLFWINVYTPNMWEHFITWYYSWEVIRVPHDEWSKRDDIGLDPSAQGEDYGSFGRILGSRFRRTISNAGVDVKRSLLRIENLIGPPSMGPTSMAAGNAALSAIGQVIKTAFGKFSERPWEYTAAIKDPGVYVVRCRATRPEDEKTVIHKLPSVAYLPIWVRKPEEITSDRVAVEAAMSEMANARLDVIQEKLKDKNLPQEERDRLEDEARDLVGSLYGTAETQLNVELRKLNKIKNDPVEWAKLDKKGQADLDKRVEEIKFILEKRTGWLKDLGEDASGSPEKIVAYFIAQEGPSANRPMRLLLEIMRMKAEPGKYRFAVLDSTSKESEHRVGPEMSDRADAIAEGDLGHRGQSGGDAHHRHPPQRQATRPRRAGEPRAGRFHRRHRGGAVHRRRVTRPAHPHRRHRRDPVGLPPVPSRVGRDVRVGLGRLHGHPEHSGSGRGARAIRDECQADPGLNQGLDDRWAGDGRAPGYRGHLRSR
jgi:hypothetical protein